MFKYLLHRCHEAQLHQIWMCIITKVTYKKGLLNKILTVRIHILLTKILPLILWLLKLRFFSRFANKHFFQKNFLLNCLPKRILVLEKKNSSNLVSEIVILSLRFAIKQSFQKNSLLHCLPKGIHVLEKRIPDSCSKSFWNRDSSQDTPM